MTVRCLLKKLGIPFSDMPDHPNMEKVIVFKDEDGGWSNFDKIEINTSTIDLFLEEYYGDN